MREKQTHKYGVNVAFLDGSTRFLSFDTPIETVEALTTIAAGDVVGNY